MHEVLAVISPMDELTKSRFKQQGDALETVAKFANELSDEIAKLKDDFARIKSWARGMLAAEIENAGNELRREMSGVMSQSIDDARTRRQPSGSSEFSCPLFDK